MTSVQFNPQYELVGVSRQITEVRRRIDKFAANNYPVLVTGETGTGKELVAYQIHKRSVRGSRLFYPMDCTALPQHLAESELLGHKRGAFTGAHEDTVGHFASASDSTLFLDEVGELPLDLQPKFHRILETGQFRPVGSTKLVNTDVRIIAATSRDLTDANKFRQELYHRLNVLSVHMPPLRERREDIEPIVGFYMEQLNSQNGNQKILAPEVVFMLQQYDFPGNVRELTNILLYGYVMSDGSEIGSDILRQRLTEKPEEPATSTQFTDYETAIREFTNRYLAQAIRSVGGNASVAGIKLGLTYKQIRHKIQSLGYDNVEAFCTHHGINRHVKLSEEELVEDLRLTGGNLSAVAKKHGVSYGVMMYRIESYGYKSIKTFRQTHGFPPYER